MFNMDSQEHLLLNAFSHATDAFGVRVKLSCRLQPIVDIKAGVTVGYEVLSGGEIIRPEFFFSSVDDAFISRLARRQIAMVNLFSHLTKMHKIKFFINVTPALINDEAFVFWLCEYSDVDICLEVDYSALRVLHGDISMENIEYLKGRGHQLWLDDFKGSIPAYHAMYGNRKNAVSIWNGIKLDKSLLWDNYKNHDDMKSLIMECREISDVILVEGIESWFQLFACKIADCNLGQGYYWRDIQL